MKALAFFVVFLIAFINAKRLGDNNSLQSIQQRIQQQQEISASTLGDNNAWNYLSFGLKISGPLLNKLPLQNIQFDTIYQNNQTELIVTATGTVWNQDQVDLDLILYFNQQNALDLFFQVDLDIGAVPQTLIPSSASAWFSGLALVGDNSLTIASATFTDLKKKQYQKGLTIEGKVQTTEQFPAQASLQQVTHTSSAVTGSITAVFPLQAGEPLAHFSVEIDSPIYFGNSGDIQVNNFDLNLQVSETNPEATLNATIQISNVGGDSTPLVFKVGSDLSESVISFWGAMQGTWNDAFGQSWLSFSGVTVSFAIDPASPYNTDKFSFDGDASIAFASSSGVSFNFDTNLASGLDQVSFTVDVPLDTIADLFSKVLKETPLMVDQIGLNGDLELTVSTFAHDGYQPGLTATGDITLSTAGSIAQAVRAVNPTDSGKFSLDLYVPIFSQNPEDIDFTLTEKGTIAITSSVDIQDINVQFQLVPSPEVTLSTTLTVALSGNNSPLQFDVSAKIDGETQLSLGGDMQGTWNQAFGLSWLSLKNLDASVAVQAGVIQTFTIDGDIEVQFLDSDTSSVTLELQGPTFKDWSFTIEVFISNVYDFLQGILNVNPPALTSEISMMTTMTLASYAAGSNKVGLTLSGSALVDEDGKLATDIEAVDPSSDLNFDVSLYVPVFSQNVGDIDFSLTSSGEVDITDNIELDGFNIQIDITPTPQISMKTEGQITLSQNQSPLTFDLSSELQGSGSLTLEGDLQGNWNQPFGLSWLSITSLSAYLSFSNKQLASLTFSGDAVLTIAQSTNTVDITLQTSSNFKDVSVQFEDVTVVSFADVIQKTGFSVPAEANDLNSFTNTVDLILSTYNYGSVTSGLSIQDTVSLSGNLLNELSIFNQDGALASMKFTLGLNIPVFGGSTDIKIFLQTSEIPIKKNLALTGIKLEVDTNPLSISIDTGCKVNFSRNPELEFDVSGTLDADGSVNLGGDMLGTWVDMFGISGLDLSNVDLALGFNPSMCEVDFCISALGLGYNLTIGTRSIAFYGYASVPNIEDIFLEGSIKGQDGMALSFQDIAMEWNELIGNNMGIPINVSDIPDDWGFLDTSFYIAPESGTFNQIHYDQGFWIDGGFDLFGIECDVDIKVTSTDFELGVSVNISEFEYFLHKELDLLNQKSPQGALVKVYNVTLDNFSTSNIASDINPRFTMDYDFLGHHQFSVGLPIFDLYDDFHNLWVKYLKSLFDGSN